MKTRGRKVAVVGALIAMGLVSSASIAAAAVDPGYVQTLAESLKYVYPCDSGSSGWVVYEVDLGVQQAYQFSPPLSGDFTDTITVTYSVPGTAFIGAEQFAPTGTRYAPTVVRSDSNGVVLSAGAPNGAPFDFYLTLDLPSGTRGPISTYSITVDTAEPGGGNNTLAEVTAAAPPVSPTCGTPTTDPALPETPDVALLAGVGLLTCSLSVARHRRRQP